MTAFSKLHPVVNFIFFAFVLVFSMLFSHPILQGLDLLCAMAFALRCTGGRRFVRQLAMLLPLMLFTALLNPLLSHEGSSVLFYFPWQEACTLEALLYGVSMALRLASLLFRFTAWNAVISTDKFVFLFGRFLPALALTVSMGLRLVPRLLQRLREVSDAQKCLNPNVKGLKHAGRSVSIVVTWALENALDTADSMKSRGYGLKDRTHFTVYRFTTRDTAALILLLLLGASVAGGTALQAGAWEYYPTMRGANGMETGLLALAYALLGLFPLLFEGREALSWRALK